jgi:hypothetical protein
MTMIYSYERAKKSFDLVFKKASHDGKVTIRKGNQLYILMPAIKNTSALDIKGINMGVTSQEIVQFIHESRKL